MKTKYYLLLLALLISFVHVEKSAAQSIIDSLKKVIQTNPYDTAKIDTYNELIWEYYGSDNELAIANAKKSIQLAEKVGYNKGLANAHRYLGNVYELMAEYPKALHHQQTSLKIAQDIGFKAAEASSLSNIGSIYERLSDYKKALEYQKQSLELCIELDQKEGIAAVYGNMGNIYTSIGASEKALEYYQKSLDMNQELGNPFGIAVSLGNIGNIYSNRGEYEKALDYLQRSLVLREEMGHLQGVASSLAGIGKIYLNTGRIALALDHFTRSVSVAREIHALPTEREANLGLYQVYKQQHNFERALLHHEEYTRLNDSIYNTEKNEDINNIRTQYALDKQQKELDQKAQEEKLILKTKAEADHARQQLIIYVSIGVLILVVIFSLFLYNRFAITNKQKSIIESQKKIVEEKNKQITDSINYAQRIQTAVLPLEEDVQRLLPNSFVLYLPKDIVSGDFYWCNKINTDEVIFVTADCTGHGVPGGFMSMLGISFLNEIINEKQVHSPDKILNLLREKIIIALRQHGHSYESKDGMDVVLWKINFKQMQLQYASANTNFYCVRKNEVIEFGADKMPIGYYTESSKDFTLHHFNLEKGDMLYAFTDGYVDQFGGPQGKKFKYAQLKTLFLKINSLIIEQQKSEILSEFKAWSGELEQVDDICAVGVKISYA